MTAAHTQSPGEKGSSSSSSFLGRVDCRTCLILFEQLLLEDVISLVASFT